MTEKLSYELIESRDCFELRRYPRHVVAEVNIRGDFMQAGNAAFGPLVAFISGRNERSQKIAMTAPVLQSSTDATTHVVSFVLPLGLKPEDVPNPTGSVVTTRVVEPRTMAAISFGGGWNQQRFNDFADKLLDSVQAAGLSAIGEVQFARFDPPWKPGFLKHNEVLVEVNL
ncbi:MAG: SOUL family heme-binding protein [Micrococcales bacterium]